MKTAAALALSAVLVSAACTRFADAPQPVRAWPVAPITAGQASDLVSPAAEPEADSNLFLEVDPPLCAGVAQEVHPPFLFDLGTTPAAHAGGQWDAPGRFSVQEMAAVYPANFDPRRAVEAIKRTIDNCRDDPLTVVTTEDDTLHFEPLPPQESGSPEIALWSLSGPDRSCDNAYVAAYNAAVEITACGDRNGYDVAALADEALDRLHALANMTW